MALELPEGLFDTDPARAYSIALSRFGLRQSVI